MMVPMAFFLSKKANDRTVTIRNIHLPLASLETRLYACAIDMVILAAISILFHVFFSRVIFLLMQALYFICFWSYGRGRTIGNRIMHIQVIDHQGRMISVVQACTRFISLLFSLITIIGLSWAFFDKNRQGLHDKLAKTVVIKTR